ncbi:MAG TPA: ketosteroid isomerase-related protein [Saprospiraceae bacterium]|nr:ketosteroid isomerase-related protein [Saprospiraceae bacterium]
MTALDIVQQYYDAFNRQDWEGMLTHLSEDIRHEVNQGDPRIGKDLYRAFLQHMDECYAETLTDMVFFTETAGKRVAVEFTVNGIYKKTDGDLVPARGQQYVLPAGAFLEVHNGKITRVTTYYNLPLWIKLVSA